MCGAIWSTSVAEVDRFPARSLVRFFRNHALLAGCGKHQWWTVKGGSIEYVRRLEAALVQRGCRIRTGQPVTRIERFPFGVTVQAAGCDAEDFDEVIFACHSDQVLTILQGVATTAETEALGSIRYQPNRAILHRDAGQMPKRRASWSSWAYRSQDGKVSVTYWMNRLQNIPEDDPLFVTLNPSRDIPQEHIYDEVEFSHPVFDQPALRAQARLRAMQGENHTWFVGAYNRYGFHEDGIASAMRVVRRINQGHQLRGTDNVSDQPCAEIAVPVDLRAPA
jgi:predicted NAD/FAD-binding protein